MRVRSAASRVVSSASSFSLASVATRRTWSSEMDMSAAINTRIPWPQKPVFMPSQSLTARRRCGEAVRVTVTNRKGGSAAGRTPAMASSSRKSTTAATRRHPASAVAGRDLTGFVAGSSADAPRDPRHRFGAFGEDKAAEFLRRRGFEVLARNVRTAYGEIDIVAMDGATVVFIEVKSRRSRGGLEAVDARKRKRLSRLALAFLARAGWLDR